MGQKHKRFRESRIPLRDIRKNPRSMYARVPQAMAQFVLKIEKLSHIMGPTPILEMARAYGLRPRLWPLMFLNTPHFQNEHGDSLFCLYFFAKVDLYLTTWQALKKTLYERTFVARTSLRFFCYAHIYCVRHRTLS